jgi:hypothetical protein
VRQRVARSRELVDCGHEVAVVARVMQISRQAIYRIPTLRRLPQAAKRPPADPVEQAIVQVAQDNPTDGDRMVSAWVCRKLGRAVNRKRVLRVMRERKLIQRHTSSPDADAPGSSRPSVPASSGIWI